MLLGSSTVAIIFRPFGTQHLMTVAVIVVLCALVFRTGANSSDMGRIWLRRSLWLALAGYAAISYLQQWITHSLNWETSLPLDLCNLVLAACILALIRPNRLISEIAYFWGLGGVVQATLTPDLANGFPSWDFTFFFWGHGATLLAISFIISDRNFQLRRNSIARMMIALNVYALVVGTVDSIGGWNYGYLCRKPAMSSLLDFLGPWPWYLLSLELISFLMFLLFYLLWRLLAWIRRTDISPAT